MEYNTKEIINTLQQALDFCNCNRAPQELISQLIKVRNDCILLQKIKEQEELIKERKKQDEYLTQILTDYLNTKENKILNCDEIIEALNDNYFTFTQKPLTTQKISTLINNRFKPERLMIKKKTYYNFNSIKK